MVDHALYASLSHTGALRETGPRAGFAAMGLREAKYPLRVKKTPPQDSVRRAGTNVVAVFGDAATAGTAAAALVAAGFAPEAVVILGDEAEGTSVPVARDVPLFGRIFWWIILWGAVGAVIGVAIGIAFTTSGIGPAGWRGVAIQVAGWAMFAHVVASLLAAYFVLGNPATRASVRAADARGRHMLTVHAAGEASATRAETVLREAHAASVGRY